MPKLTAILLACIALGVLWILIPMGHKAIKRFRQDHLRSLRGANPTIIAWGSNVGEACIVEVNGVTLTADHEDDRKAAVDTFYQMMSRTTSSVSLEDMTLSFSGLSFAVRISAFGIRQNVICVSCHGSLDDDVDAAISAILQFATRHKISIPRDGFEPLRKELTEFQHLMIWA